MSSDPIVSHGRGGAGNIAPDQKSYTDGEIVREGPLGDQGDGAYSSGRGGAGNISSPGLRPTKGKSPGDTDVIPETAMRVGGGEHDRYHVGRGGEGNIHREEGGVLEAKEKGHGHGHKEGLVEKAEKKIEGVLGHKKDGG
ncbi:hypothetical protein N7G274_005787 [Stereocaulon virgatum]|uniref:Dehydrin n=1 Tax=Stereocaulon virgatum TaxID=373712 RepID=A0ABR4A6F8_9LECA